MRGIVEDEKRVVSCGENVGKNILQLKKNVRIETEFHKYFLSQRKRNLLKELGAQEIKKVIRLMLKKLRGFKSTNKV